MAERPIFLPVAPEAASADWVEERPIVFTWHAGMAVSQQQKSIRSWHEAAAEKGLSPLLEISRKSQNPLGIQLSAFNLKLNLPEISTVSVEAAFQGSKVFSEGGPYEDFYRMDGRAIKADPRLRGSGHLTAFRLLDETWPLQPKSAFYDWLYLQALAQNPELGEALMEFAGFTDIAFNPKVAFNCQAHSAALYVALRRAGRLAEALQGKESFLAIMTGKDSTSGSGQLALF